MSLFKRKKLVNKCFLSTVPFSFSYHGSLDIVVNLRFRGRKVSFGGSNPWRYRALWDSEVSLVNRNAFDYFNKLKKVRSVMEEFAFPAMFDDRASELLDRHQPILTAYFTYNELAEIERNSVRAKVADGLARIYRDLVDFESDLKRFTEEAPSGPARVILDGLYAHRNEEEMLRRREMDQLHKDNLALVDEVYGTSFEAVQRHKALGYKY